MQIVIDMPEGTFESVKRYYEQNQECYALCAYVANGTPLPEGHGRLIDADELKKHKYHDNNRFENAVAVAQIDWAETIIEADESTIEDAIIEEAEEYEADLDN